MNTTLKSILTATIGALALGVSSQANACTGIQIQTKDGNFVSGRTLEFGFYMKTPVLLAPRGQEFTGKTSAGDGMKWISKYASVGLMVEGYDVILDGINEKGLAVGSFYFPGFAKYSVTTKDNVKISLSSSDFT